MCETQSLHNKNYHKRGPHYLGRGIVRQRFITFKLTGRQKRESGIQKKKHESP